jgi:pimeloyl-ACP methyl ester carboxylesterase
MAATVLPAGPTQTVILPDGRELAYLDFGDPASPLVIHNHGGPSSRIEGRLLAAGAVAHGLRLVSVDRPGIGRSTPHPGWALPDWVDDLTALADALGADRFAVSGWSGGGAVTMAAAALIDPERLAHVAYIAGAAYGAFGDNSAAMYLDKADKLGGELALGHPHLFHLMYDLLELDAAHLTKSYLSTLHKTLNAADGALLEEPEFAAAFGAAGAECFAQGSEGLVEDSTLTYRAWPFDVTGIQRPVHVWQGTDDHLVPLPINQQLADRVPGAVWHPIDGEDHLVAVTHADEIFALAAQDLGA